MKTYSLKARNGREWVSLYIIIPILILTPPILLAKKTFKELNEKGEICVRIENLSKERIAKILKVRDKINERNELSKGKVQMTNVDDCTAIRISYTGVMPETTKEIRDEKNGFIELSEDKSYKEAIEVLYNFRDYMRQFGVTIKYSNFNTLYLARGFIAFNNAFALLPLIFFLIVIISLRFRESFNFKLFCYPSIAIFVFLIILVLLRISGILEIRLFNIVIILLLCLLLGLYTTFYVLTLTASIFKSRFRYCFYISYRYFLRYIYLRHPVAFPIGLFYNLIIYLYLCHSIANPDQLNMHLRLPALAFFAIWSTSLAMWMGPFIRAWLRIFSKDFIDEYYRKTLHMCISDLDLKEKGHRVLLGFGRLGQGVHKELLERRTNDVSIEPLLDPSDGTTIKYLRKDMVVVDRDEKIFDHVFVDPSFEKIGVAKVNYRDIEPQQRNQENHVIIEEKEIWIPAIIGDITNESVKDYSKLKQSEFFIDTVRGYDETLSISKFARKHKKVRGIITVMDSSQKELLFPKHSGEGIFLCHPTHLQGIALGETVYSAMTRNLNRNSNSKPKVLVFTDDMAQTHYMMETILQELKLSGREQMFRISSWESYYDLNISVCSDSPETKRYCEPKSENYLRSTGLDIRNWKQVVERCSNTRYETTNQGTSPMPSYVESKIIFEKPRLMTMEKILNCWYPIMRPDIVVISYRDSAWELRVLHEFILAVERYNCGNNPNRPYKPKIIVGFRGEESEEVRDDLQYYDSRRFSTNDNEVERTRFPTQAIDARVDLNRDTIEHIGAIAEAMSNERENKIDTIDYKVEKKIKDSAKKLNLENVNPNNDWREELNGAFGIHIIDRNRHGVMPDILRRLAGLNSFDYPNSKEHYKSKHAPSFHYCRYQNCTYGMNQGNKFLFTSYATLEIPSKNEKEKQENDPDIGAMLLSVPSMLKPENPEHQEARKFVVECIKDMVLEGVEIPKGLNNDFLNQLKTALNGKIRIDEQNTRIKMKFTGGILTKEEKEKLEKLKNNQYNNAKNIIINLLKSYSNILNGECFLQVTCPPESYRRKILNITENENYFKQVDKLEKLDRENGQSNELELGKLEREKQRFYFDNEFSYKDKSGNNQKSLAKIYLCCRYGDRPGALAIALNNMLFKHLQKDEIYPVRKPDKLAFNITYLINYFSYSTNVIYKAIYGNLVDTDCGNELVNGVIDHVLICPTNDGNNQNNPWHTYAKDLKDFLNENDVYGENRYNAVRNGNNFLVYHKEDKSRNNPKVCKMMMMKDVRHKKYGRHSPDLGCDICRKYWYVGKDNWHQLQD